MGKWRDAQAHRRGALVVLVFLGFVVGGIVAGAVLRGGANAPRAECARRRLCQASSELEERLRNWAPGPDRLRKKKNPLLSFFIAWLCVVCSNALQGRYALVGRRTIVRSPVRYVVTWAAPCDWRKDIRPVLRYAHGSLSHRSLSIHG